MNRVLSRLLSNKKGLSYNIYLNFRVCETPHNDSMATMAHPIITAQENILNNQVQLKKDDNIYSVYRTTKPFSHPSGIYATQKLLSNRYDSILLGTNLNRPRHISYLESAEFTFLDQGNTINMAPHVPRNIIAMELSDSVPVYLIECLLKNVHMCGIPWWATFVTTSVLLRLAIIVPIHIHEYALFARVERAHKEVGIATGKLLTDALALAHVNNWPELRVHDRVSLERKKLWDRLVVKYNCHPAKTVMLKVTSLSTAFLLTVAIGNLTYALPHITPDSLTTYHELTVEGIAWIHDLTSKDGSFIFPTIICFINFFMFWVHRAISVNTGLMAGFMRYGFLLLTCLITPVIYFMPVSFQLSWIVGSVFNCCTTFLLMSPKVRWFLRIPPSSRDTTNKLSTLRKQFNTDIARIKSLPGRMWNSVKSPFAPFSKASKLPNSKKYET